MGNSKRAKIAKAGATLLGLHRSQDFSYKTASASILGSLRSREDKDGPLLSHSAFPMGHPRVASTSEQRYARPGAKQLRGRAKFLNP